MTFPTENGTQMCDITNIEMCNMTRPHEHICVTWLNVTNTDVWYYKYRNVQHDSASRTHITNTYVWHNSVTWLGVSNTHVWYDEHVCFYWRTHMCEMAQHDESICVTWLGVSNRCVWYNKNVCFHWRMCQITGGRRWVVILVVPTVQLPHVCPPNVCFHWRMCLQIACVSNDSAWRIYMRAMTGRVVWICLI